MKANHNGKKLILKDEGAVSNGSKLLKWKQITTPAGFKCSSGSCFQWLKVTKMKANHNSDNNFDISILAVSNGSKLLKWKQITTEEDYLYSEGVLFPMAQSY